MNTKPHSNELSSADLPILLKMATTNTEDGNYRYGNNVILVRQPNMMVVPQSEYDASQDLLEDLKWGPGSDAIG